MVISRQPEVIVQCLIGLGAAVLVGIHQAGELGALHDEQAPVRLGEEAERFLHAAGEERPGFPGGVVDHDLTAVEGGGEPAIRKRGQRPDLRVDAGWRRERLEAEMVGPYRGVDDRGEEEKQQRADHWKRWVRVKRVACAGVRISLPSLRVPVSQMVFPVSFKLSAVPGEKVKLRVMPAAAGSAV